ncbi:MAG: phosphoribosylamine--glycine ligase [Thermodesulfobacteriota bacterium]
MNILVVGGGGREHALVWKLAQSPKVSRIFCAPGNAGIAELATCVPIDAENIDTLLAFAKENAIDLTVVGPEGPLAGGIVDIFEKNGLRIFGASKKAAEIEASKSFAKSLMKKYGIPTADGKAFTSYDKAVAYLGRQSAPIVVKADGLAAGKGVLVCKTIDEALDGLKRIMVDKVFGDAGRKVVIEECLKGEEASFLAFTDGETVLPLPSSQDHKRVFDNDEGPNTGGMGAYSPAPIIDHALQDVIMNQVMIPAVRAMAAEGRPYKGVLYAGLMIHNDRVNVLEFNARFGDPETQPLLMRLKSDLVPIMEATIDGTLKNHKLEIDERPSVCVVMASEGYPNSYPKGLPISGLDKVRRMKNVVVFHAGTAKQDDTVVTSGGRVLGVTALGTGIQDAVSLAYKAVSAISWKGAHYRKDIAKRALNRIKAPAKVGIVMGSDSDLPVMEEAAAVLRKFGVSFEMTIASAHRSPARAASFASEAARHGMKVIIAGAGHAAHLAGVLAAHTTLPVIAVPIDSSALQGLDALLSTVQMPPGIPVACMAIGKSGARNAGILAVQILALSDIRLAAMLEEFKAEMALQVEEKARKLCTCA